MNAMTSITPDSGTDLYPQAVLIVRETGRASTTFMQKHFAIGYNRARALIERLEADGVVTPADAVGKREVLPIVVAPAVAIPRPASQIHDDWLPPATAPAKPGGIPMKNTEADRAVSNAAYAVAADELRQFIEQFEHLEAEKKDITEQQKDVMAEAKARGYDTKVLKKIAAIRRRDPDDVAQEDATLDLYKAAMGMAR